MRPGGYMLIVVSSMCFGGMVAHWGWEARHNELLAKLEREARKNTELVLENERLNYSIAAAVGRQLAAERKARDAKAQIITKEVVKYVEKNINSQCGLDSDFVRIHDTAIPVPRTAETTGGTDAADGQVQNLGRALDVLTHNYNVCQEAVDKLQAWQDWYQQVSAAR